MRIYTLNVNGFRGAEMQPGEYVSPQDLQMNLHNFMTLIGDIIADDQSVLIVQEFPHMTGDRSGRWFRWLENNFYNKCLETIKAKYRVIKPIRIKISGNESIFPSSVHGFEKHIPHQIIWFHMNSQ